MKLVWWSHKPYSVIISSRDIMLLCILSNCFTAQGVVTQRCDQRVVQHPRPSITTSPLKRVLVTSVREIFHYLCSSSKHVHTFPHTKSFNGANSAFSGLTEGGKKNQQTPVQTGSVLPMVHHTKHNLAPKHRSNVQKIGKSTSSRSTDLLFLFQLARNPIQTSKETKVGRKREKRGPERDWSRARGGRIGVPVPSKCCFHHGNGRGRGRGRYFSD